MTIEAEKNQQEIIKKGDFEIKKSFSGNEVIITLVFIREDSKTIEIHMPKGGVQLYDRITKNPTVFFSTEEILELYKTLLENGHTYDEIAKKGLTDLPRLAYQDKINQKH